MSTFTPLNPPSSGGSRSLAEGPVAENGLAKSPALPTSRISELTNHYLSLVSGLDYGEFRTLIGALNALRNEGSPNANQLVLAADAQSSPLSILDRSGLSPIRTCLEAIKEISKQPIAMLAADAAVLARCSCRKIGGINIADPNNQVATINPDQRIQIRVEGSSEYIEITPGTNAANSSHVKIKGGPSSKDFDDYRMVPKEAAVSGRKLKINTLFGAPYDLVDAFPQGPATKSPHWSRGSVLICKLSDGNIALFDRGTKYPITVSTFPKNATSNDEAYMTMSFTYAGNSGNDGKFGQTVIHRNKPKT